jgi:3D (Asp-Asp-Asp) domain-containing protein
VVLLIGVCVIAFVSRAATYTGVATAYASCDGSTTMTASGRQVQLGYVANNFLPLGTWIEMVKPSKVQGRKFYRVMDRGGPSFSLDFWTNDCAWMHDWGRRTVTYRTVPKREMYRGKPYKGWKFAKTRRGAKLVWKP